MGHSLNSFENIGGCFIKSDVLLICYKNLRVFEWRTNQMEICVIGAGYVGLTTAAVLADLGHVVCCVDTNVKKIHALKLGKVPIYEPGLSELIKKNEHALTFSTSTIENIKKSQVIFIAVGTPSLPDGRTDLFYLHSVIDEIAETIESYKTIIIKSTVPIGTNDDVYKTIIQKGVDPLLFNVVSNPEFLKEGSAIYDMVHPDKIVVGKLADDQVSLFVLKEIYQKIEAPFIVTSLAGAEMIKYASNAFLATKISFINEIARICDQYSINVADVAERNWDRSENKSLFSFSRHRIRWLLLSKRPSFVRA